MKDQHLVDLATEILFVEFGVGIIIITCLSNSVFGGIFFRVALQE